ncbi:MAG: PEGA domain-containing protein [Candidatus Marinimicrobia bacterium]|nr:PEGA domain-containing protein [Candidatus Neomarinimicrobiota bacterium]
MFKLVNTIIVYFAILAGSTATAYELKIALNIASSDNRVEKIFLSQFNKSLEKEVREIENFSIISKENLEKLVSGTSIDLDDCDKLGCIAEVGRLAGVDFIIAGFVKKRNKYFIDIYVIEVSKSRMLASKSFNESEKSLSKGGMKKIAKMIVSSIDKATPKMDVAITSYPKGAVVTLNNQVLGETPITAANLRKRQNYSLSFHKQGYERLDMNFTLGKQKKIHAKLVQQMGAMLITGQPFKSKIYINNKFAGKLPRTNYQNNVGQYSILIKKPGYKKYRGTFEIMPNTINQLQVQLKRKPKIPALLSSAVIPGSGQIYRGFPWRGLLFMAAAAGVGYLTAVEYMDYDKKHTQYLNDLDSYKNQADLNQIKSDKERVLSSFDLMKKQETMLNNYLYAAGAVWSINILEIFFE